MYAYRLDFWFCSCCGQFLDGGEQQPAYTFPNGDFQCSFCVFLDSERDALELQESTVSRPTHVIS